MSISFRFRYHECHPRGQTSHSARPRWRVEEVGGPSRYPESIPRELDRQIFDIHHKPNMLVFFPGQPTESRMETTTITAQTSTSCTISSISCCSRRMWCTRYPKLCLVWKKFAKVSHVLIYSHVPAACLTEQLHLPRTKHMSKCVHCSWGFHLCLVSVYSCCTASAVNMSAHFPLCRWHR